MPRYPLERTLRLSVFGALIGCSPAQSMGPEPARPEPASAEAVTAGSPATPWPAPSGPSAPDGDRPELGRANAPGSGDLPAPNQSDASPPVATSPPSSFVDLPVSGFEPAVLSIPDSGMRNRPVVAVAHGAGGDARWHCELWRNLTNNRAYVLCPRGIRMVADRRVPSGYYFPDHHHLEREVVASMLALWKAAPDAGKEDLVYVGYSQGATMGALMVDKHADIFGRLVLIEGGSHEWSIPHATRFRNQGGERVLFVCGRRSCDAGARQSAQWLRQAGVQARTEYAPGAGHTPLGAVLERVTAALPWLLEGDERWDASPLQVGSSAEVGARPGAR
jgi:predicted esterase